MIGRLQTVRTGILTHIPIDTTCLQISSAADDNRLTVISCTRKCLHSGNLSIFHQEICHLSLLDLKILLRFQYTAHRSAVDRLISLCTKRMYRRAFGLI